MVTPEQAKSRCIPVPLPCNCGALGVAGRRSGIHDARWSAVRVEAEKKLWSRHAWNGAAAPGRIGRFESPVYDQGSVDHRPFFARRILATPRDGGREALRRLDQPQELVAVAAPV